MFLILEPIYCLEGTQLFSDSCSVVESSGPVHSPQSRCWTLSSCKQISDQILTTYFHNVAIIFVSVSIMS
jgi:hypothetical protein